MTLLQYVKKARALEKKFAGLGLEEKEEKILAGCVKNPMYATDINFDVLNKNYDWVNLHKFPNLLNNYVEKYGHADGITRPMAYIGSFGSRFGWHVEDMNLYAISIMLFGSPKIWYVIPAHHGPKLEALQKSINSGHQPNAVTRFATSQIVLTPISCNLMVSKFSRCKLLIQLNTIFQIYD